MTTGSTLDTRPVSSPPAASTSARRLAAVVVVGHRTGRVLLVDTDTVREARGPDLPVRLTPSRVHPAGRRPDAVSTDELIDRLTAAVGEVVPPGVPLVLAGRPPAVDRVRADGRLIDHVVAALPGNHEHTAPAILRSHALRLLRRRRP